MKKFFGIYGNVSRITLFIRQSKEKSNYPSDTVAEKTQNIRTKFASLRIFSRHLYAGPFCQGWCSNLPLQLPYVHVRVYLHIVTRVHEPHGGIGVFIVHAIFNWLHRFHRIIRYLGVVPSIVHTRVKK